MKVSQSFIDAIAQATKPEVLVENHVYVHGYGAISPENAQKGLEHHLEEAGKHARNGNHAAAANSAEFAMHYSRGLANHATAGKMAKGQKL